MKDLNTVLYVYGDNLHFGEPDDMAEELRFYKEAGGQSILEVTTIDLARDPLRLRAISEKTGLNIIMAAPIIISPPCRSRPRRLF